MGKLIWHQYAHYVATTAAVCEFMSQLALCAWLTRGIVDAVWAGWWGIFYRKFFWDFTNGIFRDPGGIQCAPTPRLCSPFVLTQSARPANNVAIFISVIVKAPVVQIFSMLQGFIVLALELGLPPMLKDMAIGRSLVLRMVLLIFLCLINSVYYQVGLLSF